ncbi:MAG TPA: ATP-binding protein [bacterium]|nr:ATP-binding protein [bacterium]
MERKSNQVTTTQAVPGTVLGQGGDAPAVEWLDLALPAQPSSLRLVRQAVRQLAGRFKLDEDLVFALNVAVGEAVTNVIEHAYVGAAGTVYVRARRDGMTLRVEVEDRGKWRPDRPSRPGGRGLSVIRGLVHGLEVRTGADGTTVRFRFPLQERQGALAEAPPHVAGTERVQHRAVRARRGRRP